MTMLAVIRHGPTEWNAAKKLQGMSDIPLSAEGRALVAQWKLPQEFRDWRFLVSPLGRAQETARLLGAQELGVELDDHVAFVVAAMQRDAEALGLAGRQP